MKGSNKFLSKGKKVLVGDEVHPWTLLPLVESTRLTLQGLSVFVPVVFRSTFDTNWVPV